MPELPLLKIRNASVVKNGKFLLNDLNLEIPDGRHTAILGPNGSGKSSLIKLISKQLYPIVRGDISPLVTVFGHERWNIFELRTLLGIVSADLHSAFTGEGSPPGLEAVLSGFFAGLGLARHHVVTPEMHVRALESLAAVEASYLAEKPLDRMSTGEVRRVLIARALVNDPRALLLDEPTTGLDIVACRRFLETLRGLAGQGRTILLVTHHVEEIIPEIESVVLMQNGRVFLEGTKRDVLTSENLSELFGAPITVRESGGYFGAVAG